MLEDLLIQPDIPIPQALKQFNNTGEKVLLVVNELKKLIGTITDGDIRRAVLSGDSIEGSIAEVFNKSPIFILEAEFNLDLVRKILLKNKIDLLPVVNEKREVIDFITWSRAFSGHGFLEKKTGKINLPVVIMAGGKGTRLEPVTTIIPKPLIPVGSKTIVEHIMDRFINNGVKEFYFTLNYLGEMIKAYLSSIGHENRLHFVFEPNFYGTAGSLRLAKDELPQTFIVSNCDILVNADYADVVKFHQANNASLTILSAFLQHRIPYGVIDFKEDGIVTRIHEKPEKTVVINTGVYVIDLECLDYIPENKMFHMTDLIDTLIGNEKIICTYPVNENDYIDIGQWDEYRKAVKQFT
ncbi:MAG: CBS domain-containing protein [Desulfobacula sp.]|nr:CBS domain-containing protein [Desulfobacula sp.]